MPIRDIFSNSNALKLVNEYDKGAVDANLNSLWTHLPSWFWKSPLKQDFPDIYVMTFSESVISEIQNLWWSSFHPKYYKFNLDFKNARKSSEKVFSFREYCIWIGIIKMSLLRTGYLSSTANVLKGSPKTCHVNKRNFFQLSCLESSQ